uniref:Uncharacterized protein n=1 Tax=Pyxicephalus adspersus TaxID=30357 RepID=A0AAV3A3X9_PYXAD|nr:TPA: hypothetical protein GDO54_017240 [Pyxicephalus adspersus]
MKIPFHDDYSLCLLNSLNSFSKQPLSQLSLLSVMYLFAHFLAICNTVVPKLLPLAWCLCTTFSPNVSKNGALFLPPKPMMGHYSSY